MILKYACLMYHRIADEEGDFYSVSRAAFSSQLGELSTNNYSSFVPWCDKKQEMNGRLIMLTFDDGRLDNYTQAFPLLKQYGFTAVFYIIVGMIGTPGYMTWDHVREMNTAGMAIGSHTMTHPFLIRLSPDELRYEFEESKKVLEQQLGGACTALSVPRSFFNKRIIAAARRAGYSSIATSDIGWNTARDASDIIKRMTITNVTSIQEFKKIIVLNNAYYVKKNMLQSTVRTIKRLIGIERYDAIKEKVFGLKN